MEKYNTKNPISLIDFSSDELENFFQSSCDCKNQLYLQTLSMLFAYFESFLKSSIEVLQNDQALQTKIKGIKVPLLYPTCFSKLFDFILKIDLSINIKKETTEKV